MISASSVVIHINRNIIFSSQLIKSFGKSYIIFQRWCFLSEENRSGCYCPDASNRTDSILCKVFCFFQHTFQCFFIALSDNDQTIAVSLCLFIIFFLLWNVFPNFKCNFLFSRELCYLCSVLLLMVYYKHSFHTDKIWMYENVCKLLSQQLQLMPDFPSPQRKKEPAPL